MSRDCDIYADRVSGFYGWFGFAAGIPTKIPTKCRDSELSAYLLPGELRAVARAKKAIA
jgi:hypothetical protein